MDNTTTDYNCPIENINIEKDFTVFNVFRLLWLIHDTDFSNLNNKDILYGDELFTDLIDDPNEVSLSRLLLMDKLNERRFPMIARGTDLLMMCEEKELSDSDKPCIHTPSMYLSTLAHIYVHLTKDRNELQQLHENVCKLIMHMVSKYPKKSRQIKEFTFYDMGTPDNIEILNDLEEIKGQAFGTLNFFGELHKNKEMMKRVMNQHFQTQLDIDCNIYKAYSIPYFMLLHFHLVFHIRRIWLGSKTTEEIDVRVFDTAWKRSPKKLTRSHTL